MLKFFTNLLDSSKHDKHLEKQIGKDYKDNLSALGLNMALFVITMLCFLSFYLVVNTKPSTVFHAIDKDGKVSTLVTVGSPILSQGKIQNWTETAIKNIFSFNFVNVDERLIKNKVYFTPDGYEAFKIALNASKQLDTVKKLSVEVWLTPTGDAAIVKQGYITNQLKYWNVEVPAIITYNSASAPDNRKVIVSVTVVQVPTTENPNGVEISQIIVNNDN